MLKKTSVLTIIVILILAGMPKMALARSEAGLPDVAFIEGFVARGQTYALSCESRSASDLAGYWGVNAPEVEFFNNLPKSDNPEKGFVGSVHGVWGGTPPNAYGVHAKPIAELLREYGLDATARRGMTIADLKHEIANGRPVLIWVVGHVWQGTTKDYTAKDGNTVIVAGYEHTMIAYGYDLSGIYLIDAGNAARKGYSYKIFESSWAVLGNMAVTATGARETQVETQTFSSGDYYTVQKGDHLSNLAKLWGIDWVELAMINNIAWPYTIYPGQVIVTGYGAAPQKESETTEPVETPEPTETSEPQEPTKTYIVQKGETLFRIALFHGVDWQKLAEMNEIISPYTVYPGQVLEVPAE